MVENDILSHVEHAEFQRNFAFFNLTRQWHIWPLISCLCMLLG